MADQVDRLILQDLASANVRRIQAALEAEEAALRAATRAAEANAAGSARMDAATRAAAARVRALNAELDDARRGLDRADRGAGGLAGTLASLGSAGVLAVGAALATVSTGIVSWLVSATKKASDFGETLSKTDAILGESSAAVKAYADDVAKRFGLVKQQTLDAASAFGGIGKGLGGLAGKDLSDFAIKFTKLTGDVQSFANIDFNSARIAITAGLTGNESDVLKSLGVILSENAVKAYAAANGIGKVGSELTEQQKVTARAGLLMKGLADAQDDLERTAGGAANQMKKLAGDAENAAIQVGTALIPVAQEMIALANDLNDTFKATFDASIITTFAGALQTTVEAFRVLNDVIPKGQAKSLFGKGAVGQFLDLASGQKASRLVTSLLDSKGLSAAANKNEEPAQRDKPAKPRSKPIDPNEIAALAAKAAPAAAPGTPAEAQSKAASGLAGNLQERLNLAALGGENVDRARVKDELIKTQGLSEADADKAAQGVLNALTANLAAAIKKKAGEAGLSLPDAARALGADLQGKAGAQAARDQEEYVADDERESARRLAKRKQDRERAATETEAQVRTEADLARQSGADLLAKAAASGGAGQGDIRKLLEQRLGVGHDAAADIAHDATTAERRSRQEKLLAAEAPRSVQSFGDTASFLGALQAGVGGKDDSGKQTVDQLRELNQKIERIAQQPAGARRFSTR